VILNNLDFSPLLTSLAYLFGIVIVVVLFKSVFISALEPVFKSARFKGVAGEFLVNTLTRLSLNKKRYHLIKDVTLPTEDGGTTQIDLIIVSPYGVFVVETKNMRGWIFGGERQKTWTQKFHKKTFKFQNPLHQNYKHVKTLQKLIELEDNQIFSVVVFVGESTFKTEMPPNVNRGLDYVKYIKSKTEPVLSEQEIKRITDLIESGRLERSTETSKKHIEYLKQKTKKAKAPAEKVEPPAEKVKPIETSPSCPKCGSAMVLRTAKRGDNAGQEFWGCERYPKCRGVIVKPPVEKVESPTEKVKPADTSPICPKCGSAMVLRTAKRGDNAGQEFWGCERYPKCRGMINKSPE